MKSVDTLIAQGWALFHEGVKVSDADYDSALSCFQAALRDNENNASIWREYARALMETGSIRHWCTAVSVCDKILDLIPDDWLALVDKARMLYRLGQHEESLRVCARLIELDAQAYEGWYVRGWVFYAAARYEEALESFDRVLERKADLPPVWAFRGLMLHKQGRLAEALNSVNRALELAPEYSTAQCFKIEILEALGRHDEAQAGVRALPSIDYHF